MSSCLTKNNWSSEGAKKCPDVLHCGILNSENMSKHTYTAKLRRADVMTFFALHWILGDKLSICGRNNFQRTCPPLRSKNMVTLGNIHPNVQIWKNIRYFPCSIRDKTLHKLVKKTNAKHMENILFFSTTLYKILSYTVQQSIRSQPVCPTITIC